MIVFSGIRIPLEKLDDIGKQAAEAACRGFGIKESALHSRALRRVSYDARHGRITAVCSVLLELKDKALEQKLCETHAAAKLYEKTRLEPVCGSKSFGAIGHRPVVVGFGPAGIFAAYLLSLYGYRPIVLERGGDVQSRKKAAESFCAGGGLDTENNVQYGEGGAGTFSDGKLTTRINDPLCDFVLETFVKFGAPDDILYKAKPHVGSDKLPGIVKGMRQAIIQNGGEVLFGRRADDIVCNNGNLSAVVCDGQAIETAAAIIACGHSARDTILMLGKKGLRLEPKPFSVGVRIEHPQRDIDTALYGEYAGDKRLPKGEYALSAQIEGRGVYTFCMCPGGSVVAAASETGGVVTNGMSNYARDGQNANSALVAAVGFDNPFEGIEYQRGLERAAYEAGGGAYRAPAQDMAGFLSGRASLDIGRVKPTYPLGVTAYNLGVLLGPQIIRGLQKGIAVFDKKIKGFDAADAILTGPETRTSSPVRIERDPETREAAGMGGLYPCGEGAGYAGGIMSAAVDGLKSAVAIIERYKPPK